MPWTVDIKVGGTVSQPAKGVPKCCRILAGLDAAELHGPIIDTPVGSLLSRGQPG